MSGPAWDRIIPQRLAIVLPTTAAFDSRTFRIASGMVARGHEVIVLARSGEGLPDDAMHASGYRVVRVGWDPVDGLPRPLRALVRRRRQRGSASPVGPTHSTGVPSASRGTPGRQMRKLQGVAGALGRLAVIALTVRAQQRATLRAAPGADLVHAMAYMGIPIGLALGARDSIPVVYDARDIYTDAQNIARMPAPARRLFGRLERGWANRASRVMTVNEPYAAVMARRWDLPTPVVVMNCSYRQHRDPAAPRRLHDRLGLGAGQLVVLYQGGFSRDRGIEQLIEAISLVDDATLVLLGYGPLEGEIRRLIADRFRGDIVRILPAVPPDELLAWVASADVVVMAIQPSSLNHRLTTPNKLFEAMAVGVPVVASDLPGMASIVRATGCGLVCDPTDPVAIGAAISAILDAPADDRAAMRARALAAADDRYNWESQLDVLAATYTSLTGRPW